MQTVTMGHQPVYGSLLSSFDKKFEHMSLAIMF